MARFPSFVDSSGVTWVGHLATVTSSEEDDFLTTTLGDDGWLAGADLDRDGAWTWEAGDEVGQVFWDNGKTVIYVNWCPGAPSGDPAAICLLKLGSQEDGEWDAVDAVDVHGFYVEYVPDPASGVEGTIEATSWGAIKNLFW
jgi:hypothetical protein